MAAPGPPTLQHLLAAGVTITVSVQATADSRLIPPPATHPARRTGRGVAEEAADQLPAHLGAGFDAGAASKKHMHHGRRDHTRAPQRGEERGRHARPDHSGVVQPEELAHPRRAQLEADRLGSLRDRVGRAKARQEGQPVSAAGTLSVPRERLALSEAAAVANRRLYPPLKVITRPSESPPPAGAPEEAPVRPRAVAASAGARAPRSPLAAPRPGVRRGA